MKVMSFRKMNPVEEHAFFTFFQDCYYDTDQDIDEFSAELYRVMFEIRSGYIPVELQYLEDYLERLEAELLPLFPELKDFRSTQAFSEARTYTLGDPAPVVGEWKPAPAKPNGKGNRFKLTVDLPEGVWKDNRLIVSEILHRVANQISTDSSTVEGDIYNPVDDLVGKWEMTDSSIVGWIDSRWNTDDVRSFRPTLSVEEAMDVLETATANHDANVGINWDVLMTHAQDLFGSDWETSFITSVKEQLLELGYDGAVLKDVSELFDGFDVNFLEYDFSVTRERKFMEREAYDVKVMSKDGILFEVFQAGTDGCGPLLGTFQLESQFCA